MYDIITLLPLASLMFIATLLSIIHLSVGLYRYIVSNQKYKITINATIINKKDNSYIYAFKYNGNTYLQKMNSKQKISKEQNTVDIIINPADPNEHILKNTWINQLKIIAINVLITLCLSIITSYMINTLIILIKTGG